MRRTESWNDAAESEIHQSTEFCILLFNLDSVSNYQTTEQQHNRIHIQWKILM